MVKFKKGFSIAEALISATILAVVLVFALKSNTTKVKEPENTGYFKCSCVLGADGFGAYRSFYIVNGEMQDQKNGGSSCTFYPAEGIDFYTVNAWNDHSLIYNEKESGYTYALTSVPKRGVTISLGNDTNPNIRISGILTISDIVPPGLCTLPYGSEGACTGRGGRWDGVKRLCILESEDRDQKAQRACISIGNENGTSGVWDSNVQVCRFPNVVNPAECVEDFGYEWYDARPFCHLVINAFLGGDSDDLKEQCTNRNGTWHSFGVDNVCLEGANMEITW